MAEVLNDPESSDRRRSRESLNTDVVKYESGPDGGEEVSMSVEWNGVSTAHGVASAAGGCLPPTSLPPTPSGAAGSLPV